jgi:hypothetical protein
MKKFYFIGCSGTYCDDIPDNQKNTHGWPALVSQYHNASFVNGAMPGASNDFVVSQVLQNLKKFDRYYIQWTWENRFTLYNSENWHIVNFNQQLNNTAYQHKDYFKEFGKYYYAHWSSPIFEFKKWLEKVILLQNTLEKNNCQYLMLCAHNRLWKHLTVDKELFVAAFAKLHNIEKISDEMTLAQCDHIQTLLHQVNLENFINPNDFNLEKCTMFPVGPTKHPLHEGMIYAADTILKFERKMFDSVLEPLPISENSV